MKQWVKAWMLIAAVTLAGCQNGGVEVSRLPPRPVDQVDNVALRLSPPMPLNWDDAPGLDGLQAQLNLFQLDQPLSVIVEGAMEFVLYEGRGTAQVLAGKKPFRVWTFQGPELRNCMGKTMFGWGYAMRLDWGDRPPESPSITLVARYRPVRGKDVSSGSIHVVMTAN